MSESKHTPEPWKVGPTNPGRIYRDSGSLSKIGNPIARANVAIWPEGQEDANAARIVACVNACAGMADPEEEIAALREVAEAARAFFFDASYINGKDLTPVQRVNQLSLTRVPLRAALAKLEWGE